MILELRVQIVLGAQFESVSFCGVLGTLRVCSMSRLRIFSVLAMLVAMCGSAAGRGILTILGKYLSSSLGLDAFP